MAIAAGIVAAAVMAPRSGSAACDPARVTHDVEPLPAPWRDALMSVVAASSDPSKPWGCPEADLALDLNDEGATLRVRQSGNEIERRLAAPDDLLPLAKALMASPLVAAPPPQSDPERLALLERVGPDAAEAPAREPRAYVDAAAALRYLGSSDAVALGGGVRGAIPFGRWSPSLAVRYLTMVGSLSPQVSGLGLDELDVSGGVSYALVAEPLRFELGLLGTLAVVDMESEGIAAASEGEVETGTVDGRIGAELRLVVPIAGVMSALLGFDADFAPASIGDTNRRLDPQLPPMPSYTLGLTAGLEAGIP